MSAGGPVAATPVVTPAGVTGVAETPLAIASILLNTRSAMARLYSSCLSPISGMQQSFTCTERRNHITGRLCVNNVLNTTLINNSCGQNFK